MLESQVYVKTDAGRDEIRTRTRNLSMPVRAILLMVDGQRTVAGMRALIAGSKAPADVLDVLLAQGLIEARDAAGDTAERSAPPPAAPSPAAPSPAAPSPAALSPAVQPPAVQPPALQPPAVQPPPTQPPSPVPVPPPAPPAVRPPPARPAAPQLPPPTAGPVSYDGPLDLVLPTIFGADAGAPPTPPAEPALPPAGAPAPAGAAGPAGAAAVPDRYNQLYSAMNEIVRDFLPAHRRYFFQLKIERCGTAEDLLELLHDLRTSLAKGRGEAFAADVIARLRSAAG